MVVLSCIDVVVGVLTKDHTEQKGRTEIGNNVIFGALDGYSKSLLVVAAVEELLPTFNKFLDIWQ